MILLLYKLNILHIIRNRREDGRQKNKFLIKQHMPQYRLNRKWQRPMANGHVPSTQIGSIINSSFEFILHKSHFGQYTRWFFLILGCTALDFKLYSRTFFLWNNLWAWASSWYSLQHQRITHCPLPLYL